MKRARKAVTTTAEPAAGRARPTPAAPDGRPAFSDRFTALDAATGQIVWVMPASGLAEAGSAEGDLPAWRAFTGQTPAEVECLGWLEAVHPEERVRAREAWSRAAA